MNLKKANRWTNSSSLVNKPSERTHNGKASLGFHKETSVTRDLFYICGNLGHTTTKCLVATNNRTRYTNLEKRKWFQDSSS